MKTYSIDSAADFLNISADTMRDLAADGTIAGAKIGKSWVFTEEDLAEYLRNEIRKQTAKLRGVPVAIPVVIDGRFLHLLWRLKQAEAFEAAAKLCDDLAKNGIPHSGGVEMAFAGDCAAAIRQRAKENEK